MDLTMDIAQMSVNMHQQQDMQSLGIAVAKMAMNASDDALELLEETTASVDPNLGNVVDVSA
ncbi:MULTISPECIES: YjfB family protein [Selenomonas]|jgi:hypothetical protein|uniref:Motility protein n=1 Tax=Selenomonas artemidis F0399 TaxID=749551 RepID=E7N4L6_9FIRM|nr:MULTISPECIES: YjfB family protein [Selenomonas]EFR39996.1 hypothetical protein HMPREF9162_0348 [Selenomonas sp. oral taxon 137 str. F0430]EFW28848.1 hypothetical protein HMPREF9555_01964 [Selenomonas artemidis F0399]EJP29931.1 putative motility protein [Selenomonas sp. FOBRC9]MBF1681879.1 YjfB family protein [Selenomonas artemidis]